MWNPQSRFGGMNVPKLELDGVSYHVIGSDEIPPGYTSVPVKVDDNGDVFMATMMAGSVGIRYIGDNTIQPESGWFMFEDDGGKSEEQNGNWRERAVDDMIHRRQSRRIYRCINV